MSEGVLIALVAGTSGVIGAAVAAMFSFFGGRRGSEAEAHNKDASTVELQSRTINELWKQLDTLRDEFDKSKEKVEEKENEIRELKDYFKELLAFLETNGIVDYPKPKKNLLDTHDRIKALRDDK